MPWPDHYGRGFDSPRLHHPYFIGFVRYLDVSLQQNLQHVHLNAPTFGHVAPGVHSELSTAQKQRRVAMRQTGENCRLFLSGIQRSFSFKRSWASTHTPSTARSSNVRKPGRMAWSSRRAISSISAAALPGHGVVPPVPYHADSLASSTPHLPNQTLVSDAMFGTLTLVT